MYDLNSVVPEDGVLCVEDNCQRVATRNRPLKYLKNGSLIVELVCDIHPTHKTVSP